MIMARRGQDSRYILKVELGEFPNELNRVKHNSQVFVAWKTGRMEFGLLKWDRPQEVCSGKCVLTDGTFLSLTYRLDIQVEMWKRQRVHSYGVQVRYAGWGSEFGTNRWMIRKALRLNRISRGMSTAREGFWSLILGAHHCWKDRRMSRNQQESKVPVM